MLCTGYETSDVFVEKLLRIAPEYLAHQASVFTFGLRPRFFGSVSSGLVMD